MYLSSADWTTLQHAGMDLYQRVKDMASVSSPKSPRGMLWRLDLGLSLAIIGSSSERSVTSQACVQLMWGEHTATRATRGVTKSIYTDTYFYIRILLMKQSLKT